MLRKYGCTEKIRVVHVNSAFALDPNLLTAKLLDTEKKSFSLKELHEFTKTQGIQDYSSEDMDKVIRLLQSSGVSVVE